MNEHEAGFLEFLTEPSRRRVHKLLELGPRRRGDLRDLLSHKIRLDPRSSRPLTGSQSLPSGVEAILRKAGAPDDCFLLSDDPSLDGRLLPLPTALDAVIGRGGTFLSSIPGRLAIYQFAEIKQTYLLHRAG